MHEQKLSRASCFVEGGNHKTVPPSLETDAYQLYVVTNDVTIGTIFRSRMVANAVIWYADEELEKFIKRIIPTFSKNQGRKIGAMKAVIDGALDCCFKLDPDAFIDSVDDDKEDVDVAEHNVLEESTELRYLRERLAEEGFTEDEGESVKPVIHHLDNLIRTHKKACRQYNELSANQKKADDALLDIEHVKKLNNELFKESDELRKRLRHEGCTEKEGQDQQPLMKHLENLIAIKNKLLCRANELTKAQRDEQNLWDRIGELTDELSESKKKYQVTNNRGVRVLDNLMNVLEHVYGQPMESEETVEELQAPQETSQLYESHKAMWNELDDIRIILEKAGFPCQPGMLYKERVRSAVNKLKDLEEERKVTSYKAGEFETLIQLLTYKEEWVDGGTGPVPRVNELIEELHKLRSQVGNEVAQKLRKETEKAYIQITGLLRSELYCTASTPEATVDRIKEAIKELLRFRSTQTVENKKLSNIQAALATSKIFDGMQTLDENARQLAASWNRLNEKVAVQDSMIERARGMMKKTRIHDDNGGLTDNVYKLVNEHNRLVAMLLETECPKGKEEQDEDTGNSGLADQA